MSTGNLSGGDRETLIFTCAGAAYSGQVCNRAGVNLTKKRVGNLFCVAAIGAWIPDKLERARDAGKRVVIDGCDEHCARRIMEVADLPIDLHVEATTLGISKQPDQPEMIRDSQRIAEHVTTCLNGC